MNSGAGVIPAHQAEPPLVLALDVGSSSIRALVFDRLGQAIAGLEAKEPHAFRTDAAGASEADPDALLQLIFACIDRALQAAGPLANAIAAVAADTFVNNILGIDAHGRAITPLTTYADTRAAGEVAGLQADFAEAETHNRTGCRFHPSYLPARLRWLHRADPDLFRAVARWVSLDEYLKLALFGEAAVSTSVAAWTGLLDRRRLIWDEPLLAGLPITAGQLSPLVDADAGQQGVRPVFARRWPSLAQIPWFPAIGDGAAANLGCGCVGPERVALTVGTSSALRAVAVADAPQLPSGLWCYRVDARRSLPGGALTEGGSVYAWMRQTLQLDDPAAVEQALAAMRPDGHGLTLLPLFAGERSPGWVGHARATFHGLTLATTPLHLLRAGLEAVAYRIALVYAQLRPLLPAEPEIIAGGGALLASPAWLQIMADVLGRPVIASAAPEATARGAALLALEAIAALPDLSQAPVFTGDAYLPNPDHHAIYTAAIARQQHLYQRVTILTLDT